MTEIKDIKLKEYGDVLISRAEAKKVLEEGKTHVAICLDFEGVKEIYPSFADQIFRVKNDFYYIAIENTNEQIEKMIQDAKNE